MSDPLLYFNGINGATGSYLRLPMPLSEFNRRTRVNGIRPVKTSKVPSRMDLSDLSRAGWGVVFPEGPDPAVREALVPLLERRRDQASQRTERLYREFTYHPGEDADQFLNRVDCSSSGRAPYYLLLAGDPQQIPFEFQHQLELSCAVGRICFDSPDEFANYAHSVVDTETRRSAKSRRMTFFGVRNPDDPATALSVERLVELLWEKLGRRTSGWDLVTFLTEETSKAQLARLAGGVETPALLFTAGHAVCFPYGDPRQRNKQGALICNDWPGPRAWRKRLLDDHYFAADDLNGNANLKGMIAFHFACFSAGTPQLDSFAAGQAPRERTSLAPQPFVARLPQKMLSHPKGGALAVIGHVDAAWWHSFLWEENGSQLRAFERTLGQLMGGKPVGLAMESFGRRYAELASDLIFAKLNEAADGDSPQAQRRGYLWTAYQDARSYTIVGDPAVRLPQAG